jgi:hypothetical protein
MPAGERDAGGLMTMNCHGAPRAMDPGLRLDRRLRADDTKTATPLRATDRAALSASRFVSNSQWPSTSCNFKLARLKLLATAQRKDRFLSKSPTGNPDYALQ